MKNPMLSQIQMQSPIKGMMNAIMSARNPQMMLQQMAMQNPQLREVMEYVNQNGGDAQKAFYAKAKEMGIDPNEVIKAMRNA